MTLTNSKPLAIYAMIAVAVFAAAYATNPRLEPFWAGLFMIALGLWDFSDFQKGQSWASGMKVDRTNQPALFWIGHTTIQAVVALALLFPWLYPLFEHLTS